MQFNLIKKCFDDVEAFHDKFGLVTPAKFTVLPKDLHVFRANFIREELDEYVTSVKQDDIATAIDSIVDTVYVIVGAALLAGIKAEDVMAQFPVVANLFSEDIVMYADDSLIDMTQGVCLPQEEFEDEVNAALTTLVEQYDEAFELNEEGGFDVCGYQGYQTSLLSAMLFNAFCMAINSNIEGSRFSLFWDDVQRANMSKQRAVSADQSKRGSTYDVIKPEGWVGPQTEAIMKAIEEAAVKA